MALNEFKMSIRKEDIIGLENVDNTADKDKPISTAQETRFKGIEKSIQDLQTDISENIETSISNIEESISKANASIKANAMSIDNTNKTIEDLSTNIDNRLTKNENLYGAYDIAHDDTNQIERNTGYYTFTGNEGWTEINTSLTTKKRYQVDISFLNIKDIIDTNEIADIIFPSYKTISADNTYDNIKGIAIDGGFLIIYDPNIQTLNDLIKFVKGKCLQYKLVNNYYEDKNNYYQEYVNHNNLMFLNDEFSNSSNLIDSSKIINKDQHIFGESGLDCFIPKGVYYLRIFNFIATKDSNSTISLVANNNTIIDNETSSAYFENFKKIVFASDVSNLDIVISNNICDTLKVVISKYPILDYREYKGEIIHKSDLVKYLDEYIAEALGGEY